MKDFMELAKARYSVRKFKDTAVEADKIAAILEAAKIAPTAKNYQPQKIYVLQSEEALKKANKASPCIYGAPLVFAVAYDPARAAHVAERADYNFGEVDASIVQTHMMLEAADLGLGSCWVGKFGDNAAEILGLPEGIVLEGLLPVGYVADDCEPADRHTIYRPDEEMVEYL